MSTLIAGIETRKITHEELGLVPTPEATASHQPIPHRDFALEVETGLEMRGIHVIKQEFAVSPDGMRCFGLMVTDRTFQGVNFSIGLRNSNDKSMKIGIVAGYRVMVCENMAFSGDFKPLDAKHTSKFSLQDAVAVAVDRAHRGISTVETQILQLRQFEVSDQLAKDVIYNAFVGEESFIPKQAMDSVHDNWFHPPHPEFEPRTAFSLHNAFTSGLKTLKPVRQFQATGKLTPFLLKGLEVQ
jgi:hypothetical protein